MEGLVQLDREGMHALQGPGFLLYAPQVGQQRVPRLILNLSRRPYRYRPSVPQAAPIEVPGADIGNRDGLHDWLRTQRDACELPFCLFDFVRNPWGAVFGKFPALFSGADTEVPVTIVAESDQLDDLSAVIAGVLNSKVKLTCVAA